MLPRDCSCDILVKNVADFCPCPETLLKTKVKSFELIPLAEEILNHPNIDSVRELLVVTPIKMQNVQI